MAYLGNDLQVAFPTYRNIDDISGSFNGVTTSFPLTVAGVAPIPAPINSQQCLISVNGVVQRPDDSGTEGFRLSGGNIIFASAPAGGVDFFGVILAGADYVNIGANFPSGTAVAPSITFDSDLDTGIYNPAGNQIGFTTSGVQRLVINSSGQISGGLGTAAAPVISFISDPNTGIYSPGADQVAISTGGSGRLFVDASGNVGVSATPTSLGTSVRTLEIKGAATNRSGGLSLTSSDNSANAFFYTFDNVSYLGTTATPLSFFTNNTERLRITSAGLVGVGVSSPQATLDIFTSSVGSYFLGGGGDNKARQLAIKSSTTTNSGDTHTIDAQSGTGVLAFAITGSEAMRIDSSGRVGIGTTSPGALLHAAGKIRFGSNSTYYGEIDHDAGSTGANIYDHSDTGGHIFRNGGQEALRIDGSKRLLVGTSTSLGNYLSQISYAGSSTNNGLYIKSTSTSADASAMVALERSYTVNNTDTVLFYADTTVVRFAVRNNGGIANYQANDVNLSDINTKKDISPAADTWDCLKQWEIVNYRYKDQPDNTDLSLGVIAQQVAESCPEVIAVFEEAKDDQPEKLGVKEQQMYWMAIKALQEAQVRIEALEAEVAALKAQ